MLAVNPSQFPLLLRSVYVRQSNAWMKESFDPFIPNQRLTARFRNKEPQILVRPSSDEVAESEKPRVITYLIKYEFAFAHAVEEKEETNFAADESINIAEVHVVYGVDYAVRGKMPSDDELKRWGTTSAVVHSWAYWREFCQSTLSRMSLPAIVMPMLDVQAVLAVPNPLALQKKKAKKKVGSERSR